MWKDLKYIYHTYNDSIIIINLLNIIIIRYTIINIIYKILTK